MTINEVMNRKLYIDMDGVVADCEVGTILFNHAPLSEVNRKSWNNVYWQNVLQNADIEKFFENLPWMENGQALLHFFDVHDIPYTFLTRPTRGETTEACIAGKNKWLHEYGLDSHPVIFEFDKEKYAGNGNILIDDHSGNIAKWKAAGGIGFVYSSDNMKEIIKEVMQILHHED
jgi:hypothetical protein